MILDEVDEPELLKAGVNGGDGFVILPSGEDDGGVYFPSLKALRRWADHLAELVGDADNAQSYDEWLEMHSLSRGT